jgi:hypothetical protein
MKTLFLFTSIVLAVPRVALACAVCFGQSDSPMAIATNLGIMAMLVVVAGMLASFASFFIYLNRRAKLAGANTLDATSSTGPLVRGTEPQEGTAQC